MQSISACNLGCCRYSTASVAWKATKDDGPYGEGIPFPSFPQSPAGIQNFSPFPLSQCHEGNEPYLVRKGETQQHVSVQIIVAKDEEIFHAYAPALKGLHVDGATQEEAIENVKEAIAVYLESLRKHGDPLPEGPGLISPRA